MIRERTLLLSAVSALALAGSIGFASGAAAQTSAIPQSSPVPSSSAQSETDTVGEVVVTGFRGAYASALQTKRSSDQITDSISSDGLGRFPDLNVGEAIQRLPGVQINREADSRNATISLRGLPGSFARTTLNGSGFADPILSTSTNMGSTPLGAFNSDIFRDHHHQIARRLECRRRAVGDHRPAHCLGPVAARRGLRQGGL